MPDNKCMKCDGCGKVATDDEQTPWSLWENLPPGSDLTVKMGLIKPITCPECNGSGEQANKTGGEQIIDMIVSASLCTAECAEDETHGCLIVWSSNAAEQIQSLIDDLKGC